MNAKLKKMTEEVKVFGIKQVAFRILYKLTGNEKYCTKFLMERDKTYSKLDMTGLLAELKRIYGNAMGKISDNNKNICSGGGQC